MAALHLVQVSILIVLHVLHVLFTFVSFVLSSASKLFSRPRASVTGLSSSSAQRKPPPRHVSLILVPPRSGTHQADLKLEEVMLESIRRLLTWAAEEGVEECSVFEPGRQSVFSVSFSVFFHSFVLLL
ncbi:hypothetical protein [Phaffia rhodozyma]|uniref:Uncharacterized protein n=1 Tax=Phaffia rhodozyma TaxID=264483 RepID=A0A0F7SR29_PHARH|nr:hypothetical protein [Phaffia rhodozyma]